MARQTGQLVVVHADGRTETYRYDEVYHDRTGQWDQELLLSWRQEKGCKVYCNCRQELWIRMMLRNHPKYKEKVQVLYSEREEEHADTCFRYKHIGQSSDRIVRKPAISTEKVADEEGTREITRVHLKKNFFFEEVEPSEKAPIPTVKKVYGEEAVSPQPVRYVKRTGGGGTRLQQSYVDLGKLMLLWYLAALKRAKAYHGSRGQEIANREMITNSLWMSMLKEDVTLNKDDRRRLRDFAFVPSPKVNKMRPEYKLVVGFVKARQIKEDGEIWLINGVRQHGETTVWPVHVRKAHLPNHKQPFRMAAIKTVVREQQLVSLQRVFDAIITNHGAVWVDSEYEEDLYYELHRICKDQQWNIEKPYEPSDEFGGFQPDFVLRGPGKPIVIEVWGMMKTNEEYRDHAMYKIQTYRALERSGIIRYIGWDVEKDKKEGMYRLVETVRTWLSNGVVRHDSVKSPDAVQATRIDLKKPPERN